MIHVILVIWLTRQNNLPFRVGIIRGDKATLAGGLAESYQKDHCLVSRCLDSDIEQCVFLFIEQVALIAAQHVTEKLIVALGNGVFRYVEHCLVVSGPDYVINSFDVLWKEFTRLQV